MAQSDQVVQNATFPSVRADINDNLAALFSQSSGSSAPTVTVAFQPWIDQSVSPPLWKIRNGSNSGWITIGALDPTAFSSSGIPTGQIIHVGSALPAPTGYLPCDGAPINRVAYSALFTAIGTRFGAGNGSTTFNVPDLRGEFIRGWDSGRGIDSGRVLGSFQDHQFQNHLHGVCNTAQDNLNTGTFVKTFFYLDHTSISSPFASQNAGSGNAGAETRPRNIALLACIKF
jgi:microcystin-dependent protein